VASGGRPVKAATDFAEELIEGRSPLWRWVFLIKKSVNQRHQWSFSSAAATSDRRHIGVISLLDLRWGLVRFLRHRRWRLHRRPRHRG
jgi:hypothetical protein